MGWLALPVLSLVKTLLAFALLHILYSKVKFDSYSSCFLTSYFCTPVPYNEEDIFFFLDISSRRSCRSSCLQDVKCQNITCNAANAVPPPLPYLLGRNICLFSLDSTSFVKLWQPRYTNLLLNYYQPGHTMMPLLVYTSVFPAKLGALKRQQLYITNIWIPSA